MEMENHGNAQGAANIRQLRHDLLNPLNVLFGMTKVLLDMDLNDTQRTCVQACRNSAERLLDIAHQLERYIYAATSHDPAGPAQLADLCSIAAARVDKPFDRDALLAVVRELAPAAAPRILLVDDAPEIAVLVRTFLQETNCTIDVVADGEQAIAQASSQSYDLVLMDIDLPGLDGATAAHVIRAADLARGVQPAPVVAMSAVASSVAKPSDEDVALALDDPDIAPLMPSFLENRRRDAQLMRALLERAAFNDIQSIGHNMKGTGRSYGVDAVSRIGAEIERTAHRRDASSVATALDRLDELLGRIKVTS